MCYRIGMPKAPALRSWLRQERAHDYAVAHMGLGRMLTQAELSFNMAWLGLRPFVDATEATAFGVPESLLTAVIREPG